MSPSSAPGGADPRPVVVGVDGGGTGSRAVVLDLEGRELAREVGSAAIVIPGVETSSLEALRDLVRRALRVAAERLQGAAERLQGEAGRREGGSGAAPQTPPAPLTCRVLVAGLAGVGREGDRARMETLLAASGMAEEVAVRNDAEVALHDAFGHGPGLLLVAGTGSIALARYPGGRRRRAGGWGALAGDEGSGWWLGLGAVRAALRALDGRGPETALVPVVAEHLGTGEPAEIVDRMRTAAKGEVAALAPRVVRAAELGDPVATGLADQAARALADHLVPLVMGWRVGGEAAVPEAPIPLALLGGLVVPGGPLRSRLLPLVESLGVVPGALPPDPARGAAALALGLARGEGADGGSGEGGPGDRG